MIADATNALVEQQVGCNFFDEVQPKGFARPVNLHLVTGFKDAYQHQRTSLSRTLDHIEVNMLDSSEIPGAIRERKQLEKEI